MTAAPRAFSDKLPIGGAWKKSHLIFITPFFWWWTFHISCMGNKTMNIWWFSYRDHNGQTSRVAFLLVGNIQFTQTCSRLCLLSFPFLKNWETSVTFLEKSTTILSKNTVLILNFLKSRLFFRSRRVFEMIDFDFSTSLNGMKCWLNFEISSDSLQTAKIQTWPKWKMTKNESDLIEWKNLKVCVYSVLFFFKKRKLFGHVYDIDWHLKWSVMDTCDR